jgi:non-ribosomal peptide synthetase component E (peptide arylation enzyme)
MEIESNVTQRQLEEYTRLGFWDRWTLCDYIKRWGAALPDKEALVDAKKRLTPAAVAFHFLKRLSDILRGKGDVGKAMIVDGGATFSLL